MKHYLALFFLLTSFTASAVNNAVFKVDSNYLRKYDIVYLDPDYEGYNGFPLGNGDVGGMLWVTENGIEIQVNKINLYDRPGPGQVALKSAGRLSVDFGVPCNDYLYLSDFEHRLSLLGATTQLKSETAFVSTRMKSWVDASSNVWVVECEADYKPNYTDGSDIVVALERWGSRHFGDWYNSCEKDASLGLGKTHTTVRGNDILLTDTLEGGLRFSLACRVVGGDFHPLVRNRHKAELQQRISAQNKFYILLSVVTSDEHAQPAEQALAQLNQFVAAGLEARYSKHTDFWRTFWNKSFVKLDNDYVENIYYLRRYLAGSSSRGNYPVPFNGGLWVWNRDHRQWITSVHWNTQQSYWGLAEQNDADLMKPYLKTYFRLMPKAEQFVKERHGIADAIRWTEVHDFDGNMLHQDRGDMKYNYTPASQIAAIFWNYYEFTEDKVCLKDTIYPFMKEAAELYLNLLKWDEEKKQYYLYPAQPYEHPYTSDLKNPITDRYMIESLFRNCIQASWILNVDAKKRKEWEKVISHLWEPPVLDVPGRGKVFVMAYKPDGEVYPNMDTYYKRQFYHCDAHTTMVFPANLLGLNQQGTEYYEIAKKIALYHPANRNAITPGAIVSARLGLGDKVMERLENTINYLQHFNQGLFYNIDHWYVLSRYAKRVENADLVTQRDYVFDSRSYYGSYAGNSGLWAKPFIQCGMEPMNIIGTAVNEMLLQSHEGKIRVFPAWPKEHEMAFTLCARGGFTVSARINKEGMIPAIEVQSLHGNECRIQNPWGNRDVQVYDSKGRLVRCSLTADGVIRFRTVKGETYLIGTEDIKGMQPIVYSAERNDKPKFFKEATLGKPRTFWSK